jgi:hypothetical protein
MRRRKEKKTFYEILVIDNALCYADAVGVEFVREEDAKEYCDFKNSKCEDPLMEYVYTDFEREV